MKSKVLSVMSIVLIILVFVSANAFAQGADRKSLTIDDYYKWRNIVSPVISEDGNWIAFGYHGVNRDDTLYVKNIISGKEYEIPRASSPQISDDGKWAAYNILLPFKQVGQLRKTKKPVPVKAELLNLDSGEKFQVDNAASFSFAKGSKFFTVKKTKLVQIAKHRGTDLLLRNLESGANELIGSVAESKFNKPGTLLAYTVDAADSSGNGLYLINLESGARRPLDNDRKIYERLIWDKEGTSLAVLKGTKNKKFKQKDNTLLAYKNLSDGNFTAIVFNPDEDSSFPENMVVSEKNSPEWSEDLSMIFFGIKEQEPEPKKSTEPIANVDVFHWKDPRIQTVQIRRAPFEMNFTYRAALGFDNKNFVRLTDKTMKNVMISRNGKWGIGIDDREYVSDWKERQADYYRVNILTGERNLILKGQKRTLGISPDSRHFIYWKDGHIYDYNIETDTHSNLTANAPVS
ncbi:hypothetical protein ACFL6G_00755 [candidate division KSB1 bacterium]